MASARASPVRTFAAKILANSGELANERVAAAGRFVGLGQQFQPERSPRGQHRPGVEIDAVDRLRQPLRGYLVAAAAVPAG